VNINAPISLGELIDKLTILEIKLSELTSADQIANVMHEHELLNQILYGQFEAILPEPLNALKIELAEVNQMLWQVEDDIRDQERLQQFDARFIELARSVYKVNDHRCALKRQINQTFGSDLIEEKSYTDY